MRVLGIDTTRKRAKIFILNDDIEYVENINENVKHSEGLFLYLEKALLENRLELQDFDCFAGMVGPGSFTGIRVGMSVIKGFNQVFHKKIIALNVFEVLSERIKAGVVLLNSTNSTCYFGEIKNFKIVNAGVIEKEQIKNRFDSEIYILQEEQSSLDISYNKLNVIEDFDDLFFKALRKKITEESGDSFEPYYLQLSQAERNLNDKSNN